MIMTMLTYGKGWEKDLASFILCRAQGWDLPEKKEGRGEVNLTSEAGVQLSLRPVGSVTATQGEGTEPTIRYLRPGANPA